MCFIPQDILSIAHFMYPDFFYITWFFFYIDWVYVCVCVYAFLILPRFLLDCLLVNIICDLEEWEPDQRKTSFPKKSGARQNY